MNFRFILNIFGRVLILLGAFMLTSIIWALVYKEEVIGELLLSSLLTLAAGTAMYFFTLRDLKKELGLKDSYFTVTFTWVIISISARCLICLPEPYPMVTTRFLKRSADLPPPGRRYLTTLRCCPRASCIGAVSPIGSAAWASLFLS